MRNRKLVGAAAAATLTVGGAMYVADQNCPPGHQRKGWCVIAPPKSEPPSAPAPSPPEPTPVPPSDTFPSEPPPETTEPEPPPPPPSEPPPSPPPPSGETFTTLLSLDSAQVAGAMPEDMRPVAKAFIITSPTTQRWSGLVSYRVVLLDAQGDTIWRRRVEWTALDPTMYQWFLSTSPTQQSVLAQLRDPLPGSVPETDTRRVAVVYAK